MTIWTQTRRRERVLENLSAPFTDSLSVSASEALLYSPTSSLRRMWELHSAETDLSDTLIDAESARARIKEADLDLAVPDTGIRERALDILIDRKKDERRRRDILNRAQGGVFPTTARFGVALAASMLDPLNVAASFVPVVGPTRYAGMLANQASTLGRRGVRARVGAVEGAAGAALVEPIVLAATSQEQADYGLVDSLFNLALGTALGGGLHVGTGAVRDALARRHSRVSQTQLDPLPRVLDSLPFETREAALRTSVAQAMSGRNIDVMPVLRTSEVVRAHFGAETRVSAEPRLIAEPTPLARDVQAQPDLMGDVRRQMMREFSSRAPARAPQPKSLFQFLADEGGLRDQGGELKAMDLDKAFVPGRGRLVRQERGMSLDEARRRAVEAGYIFDPGDVSGGTAHTTIDDLLRALRREQSGERVFSRFDADLEAARLQRQQFEEIRAELERAIDEVADVLTDDIPDTIKQRAVEVRLAERVSPDDALERAIMEAYDDAPLRSIEGENIPFDTDPTIDAGRIEAERGPVARAGTERTAEAGPPFAVGQELRMAGEFQGSPHESLHASARASFDPENVRLADFEAARAADEALAASPRTDEPFLNESLEAVMEDLDQLARNLGDEALPARELADFDQLAKTAEDYGAAVRAAADCRLRKS